MQKKLLLQAAACNLALMLRTMLGAGTPRGPAPASTRLLSRFLLHILTAFAELEREMIRERVIAGNPLTFFGRE